MKIIISIDGFMIIRDYVKLLVFLLLEILTFFHVFIPLKSECVMLLTISDSVIGSFTFSFLVVK